MHPSNDLSRSLVPFECNTTIVAVVELSQKTWLVGGIVPGINRYPEKKISPDEQALITRMRWRRAAGSVFGGGPDRQEWRPLASGWGRYW